MNEALRTTVSKFGTTWTFLEPTMTGQFCNGDWWALTPFVLVAISPNDPDLGDAFDYHGSMINFQPMGSHGFYNFAYSTTIGYHCPLSYDRNLNIARQLPYTVSSPCSISSVINQTDIAEVARDKVYFKEWNVLTSLASAPLSDAFRPPWTGQSMTIPANRRESSINYNALPKLPIPSPLPSDYPSLTYLLRATERVIPEGPMDTHDNSGWKTANGEMLTDGVNSYNGGPIFPGERPLLSYGGQKLGPALYRVASWLMLDHSNVAKRDVLVNMVQLGIDYSGVTAISSFMPVGGHNVGREFAGIIAGKVLNDSEILGSMGDDYNSHFCHFFVEQADIDKTVTIHTNGQPYMAFTQDMLGKGEWANAIWAAPNPEWQSRSPQMFDNENGNGIILLSHSYRQIGGGVNKGVVLIATLMEAVSDLDNPPLFDYIFNKWVPRVGHSTDLGSVLWIAHMVAPAAAVCNPPAGIYEHNTSVSISTSSVGAVMRMTLTGVDPDENDQAVVDDIVLDVTKTIKVRCYMPNLPPSSVAVFPFTVITNGTPAPPTDLTLSSGLPPEE